MALAIFIPSSSSPYYWEEPHFTSPGSAGLWVGMGALNPSTTNEAEVSLSRKSHFSPLDGLSQVPLLLQPSRLPPDVFPPLQPDHPWRPSSTTPSTRRG